METTEKRVKIRVLTSSTLYHADLGTFRVKTETAQASKERVPLDFDHDDKAVVGYAENFQFNENEITADGVVLLGEESPDDAKTFAQNIDGGVPFEASPLLDLSEAQAAEGADGVVEYSGAIIRGVAICPYGTDRNTVVSLKFGETNFKVQFKKGDKMEEKKPSEPDPRADLESMIDEFGLERGVEFFRKGLSVDEARAQDYSDLKASRLAAAQEKKEPCAVPQEEETPEPPKVDEEEEDKKFKEELKAEIKKLSQELTALKATFRRGDPSGVSPSFSQEETASERPSFKNPLEAAAYKFKRNASASDD